MTYSTAAHAIMNIASLRPTRFTVGLRTVEQLRAEWSDTISKFGKDCLSHLIPVVKGPKNQFFITRDHRLVRALHDEGIEKVECVTIKDLSALSHDSFWLVMDYKQWTQPYNIHGARVSFRELPKTIAKLEDDPFRSIVSELMRNGSISSHITEHEEYLWNDYLRNHLDAQSVKDDFNLQVGNAMILAKGRDASYLPGWKPQKID